MIYALPYIKRRILKTLITVNASMSAASSYCGVTMDNLLADLNAHSHDPEIQFENKVVAFLKANNVPFKFYRFLVDEAIFRCCGESSGFKGTLKFGRALPTELDRRIMHEQYEAWERNMFPSAWDRYELRGYDKYFLRHMLNQVHVRTTFRTTFA